MDERTTNSDPGPPCSFCGARETKVSIGFRAMICATCIQAVGEALGRVEHGRATAVGDHLVAGSECVFCEKILTLARFSLHRWIFGICDRCACGISAREVAYSGPPGTGFAF